MNMPGLARLVSSVVTAQTTEGWMPPQASRAAAGVDDVFIFIFWICAFFCTLILVLAGVFVVKYRAAKWREPEPSPSHHMGLELTWSIIPTVLILVIFGWSTNVWNNLMERTDSPDVRRINVTARKWSWWFDYPQGKGSSDLHVVKGEKVQLVMSSDDVLHSFYVPAFRAKQDIVPGRFTYLSFEAIEDGTYPVKCAEYCGTNHSLMLTSVVVHEDQAGYDKWAAFNESTAEMSLLDLGKLVYESRGCKACHSLDGAKLVGPTFKGMWAKESTFTDGTKGVIDAAYVRESIIEPKRKVVAGYAPVMPPAPLEAREIAGIAAFIESLKD